MADLQRLCIEGLCAEVPEYIAGNNITIDGDDLKVISADLSNYYDKADVDAIIGAIEVGGYEIVDTLPATGQPMIIYLVPRQAGGYERWIYSNDTWIDLGDTDTVYTAGDFITISDANVISATDMRLKDAGNDTVITAQYSGAAVDADYIAGWDNYKVVAMNKATSSTASNNSENSRIASTAFVQNAINRRLPKSIVKTWVDNFTIANSTATEKEFPWSAPANGALIGMATAVYAANATGIRRLKVNSMSSYAQAQLPASANGAFVISVPFCVQMNTGNKIKVQFYQNSGGNLAVSAIQMEGYFITY